MHSAGELARCYLLYHTPSQAEGNEIEIPQQINITNCSHITFTPVLPQLTVHTF
jgi:hypothetical protein